MVLRTSNPSAGSICTVTRSRTWSFRVFVQSNYKKGGLTMKFTVHKLTLILLNYFFITEDIQYTKIKVTFNFRQIVIYSVLSNANLTNTYTRIALHYKKSKYLEHHISSERVFDALHHILRLRLGQFNRHVRRLEQVTQIGKFGNGPQLFYKR